jgi:hypothetical protein
MATRTARLNCNGRIHDDDSRDIFGRDEEESYSWSKGIALEQGGFSRTWEESHTVDGEVQLRLKVRLQCEQNGKMTVSGVLELWEGGGYWTLEKTEPIDNVVVDPDETKTIFEGRLSDDQGDWADVKFEVQNVA